MRAIETGAIHEALANDGIGRAALADVERSLEEGGEVGAELAEKLADLVCDCCSGSMRCLGRIRVLKGRAFHGYSYVRVTVTPGAMGDKVALGQGRAAVAAGTVRAGPTGVARQWPSGPC